MSIKLYKQIVTLLLLFITVSVSAQIQKKSVRQPGGNVHRCGTQAVWEDAVKKNPALKQQLVFNRSQLAATYNRSRTLLRTNAIYTIPVVVHIILPDPTLVTNAQVQSQMDVLNADFAGLNADSTRIPAAFKAFFGKGNIRFCLAQRDTKGDATTGIIRVSSSVASVPGSADPVKFSCTGGSDAWDPSKYLNIWVCQMTGGFLGYSDFASEPLSQVPLNERGFVNNYRAFGKGGTAQAPFNLGRTATHEIGHYFDLDHIWGPNNCDGPQSCFDDDGITDTPTQFECTFGTPAAATVITDACQSIAPGIMWMNFMDYVDDAAMVMYTPLQQAKMQATLLTVSWMSNLLTSDGCVAPVTVARDIRFEKFTDPSLDNCGGNNLLYVCNNSFRPNASFKNTGTDTIRSFTVNARFGTGAVVTTSWTGVLPPQNTLTLQLNQMMVNTGLNTDLVVYTSNPNGSADLKTSNDTGKLAGVVYPVVNLPYNEGFESISFPPVNWRRSNPDAFLTWERTTRAAKTGTASMFINNFDYDNNKVDDMTSPLLQVKGKDSVYLSFQVAAATYSRPDLNGNPFDTLQVLVTADCGATYRSVYKKWGKELITTGLMAVDTGYVPTTNQWRRDSVFLGNYAGAANDHIQVVIRNTSNFENNIYIDDVQVYARDVNPNLLRKGIMATPNPFRNKVVLQHYPSPVNIEYIHVYDYTGRLVWQQRLALGVAGDNPGPNYLEIDLSKLSTGVYILQVVYRSRSSESIRIVKTQ
ncbi:MAG TPA: M43 family zinc metalloprotease [Lacibacter sp.]|nr:M43 family zinc metalloprotease [Lacibacter sp.]